METRQLRYLFVTLARERHGGRAAPKLHISQPALRCDIRKFEAQLGVGLLTRASKQVAGALLFEQARHLRYS